MELEKKLAPWKALKEEHSEVRRKLKALGTALAQRLTEARSALSAKDCRELVLALARNELEAVLRKYRTEHLQEVIDVLANLWGNYAVGLRRIERAREDAEDCLGSFLKGLGYE